MNRTLLINGTKIRESFDNFSNVELASSFNVTEYLNLQVSDEVNGIFGRILGDFSKFIETNTRAIASGKLCDMVPQGGDPSTTLEGCNKTNATGTNATHR